MKKIITGCLGIGLGLFSFCNAVAEQYIDVKTGVCSPRKRDGLSYKNAQCFSTELGIVKNSWRLGVQLGYIRYKSKNSEADSRTDDTIFNPENVQDPRYTALSIMTNLYHDWKFHEKMSIYVGCGLGVARLNYRFYDNQNIFLGGARVHKQSKNLLAAQVMCGIVHNLNDHWSVSLGYHCMKMENVKYNAIQDATLWPSLKTPFLHSLEVGLRYKF